jgi:hypothetical protein
VSTTLRFHVFLSLLSLLYAGQPVSAAQAEQANRPPAAGPVEPARPERTATQHEAGRIGRDVASGQDVRALTLVRSAAQAAAIRFGSGSIETIAVGDRIGRNKAVVKEIVRGRIVLEETFVDANGSPNSVQIIIKDGQTGGTRYLRHPEDKRPVVTQPGGAAEPAPGQKP